MNLVDDALDLLLFILFLGICLTISFGIVLPIVYEHDDLSSEVLADKTTPVIKGLEIDSTYDGTLSKLDIILMTQIQDFDLPAPQRYKVKHPSNATVVDVNIGDPNLGPHYRSDYNLRIYGERVRDILATDTALTNKYRIIYQDAGTGKKTDDSYILQKVN